MTTMLKIYQKAFERRSDCTALYNFKDAGHTIFGGVYCLNSVRPITRWRKLKAFLCLPDSDTFRQHKWWRAPKTTKDGLNFDGTKTMTRPHSK